MSRPRVNLETSVAVDRVRGVPYVCTVPKFNLGWRGPYVVLQAPEVGAVFISTTEAVRIGYELCKTMSPMEFDPDAGGELVVLTLNGQKVMLLPSSARQIGGVMIRKAMRADEWQRAQAEQLRIRA